MTRIQRYKFLQIFGDALPHSYFEVIFLGCQHLKLKQKHFEPKIFKKALADGLIVQVHSDYTRSEADLMEKHDSGFFVGPDWTRFDYKITPKGDECLRNEQIARDGDYSYYRNFDRTLHGQWGTDHFAPLPNGYHPSDYDQS